MSFIAVIDTETTWGNEVMSIGVVLADSVDYKMVDSRYYIIDPKYKMGGMFSSEIFVKPEKMNVICSREDAVTDMKEWFSQNLVSSLFAYNASFDKKHLNEFGDYNWFDIMRIAAYKQYNHMIPEGAECCKTGRLKRNYGVEPIMRLLSENRYYYEQHNALQDAIDELKIMELLCKNVEEYEIAAV